MVNTRVDKDMKVNYVIFVKEQMCNKNKYAYDTVIIGDNLEYSIKILVVETWTKSEASK